MTTNSSSSSRRSNRSSRARLASGTFLIRLQEGCYQGNLREVILFGALHSC